MHTSGAQAAFLWIVDLLEKHKISFQIAGGLAAQHYGSTRPLNDIDIDLPEESFARLLPELTPYITYGPKRFKDRDWEIYLLTLNYEGQEIDLSGSDKTRIFNVQEGRWERLSVDFSQAVQGEIFGKKVPIIPRSALIYYKAILNREVDRQDLSALAAES